MGLERHSGNRESPKPFKSKPNLHRSRRPKRSSTRPRHALQFRWASAIPNDGWGVYQSAIQAIKDAGVEFLLGGGFAMATFSGRWRDTKDIDFYIRPTDRDKVVAALTKAGFVDYYERLPYDRKWIYRSTKGDFIVDIIWAMANQRTQVDEVWFQRAGKVRIRNETLRVVPIEEFIWCKFYILQRDHCDWTDIFNVLYRSAWRVDWEHLLGRLEEDVALAKALLTLYCWLCPKAAKELPASLWSRLDKRERIYQSRSPRRNHIRLLDSRDWFAGNLPKNRKLAV